MQKWSKYDVDELREKCNLSIDNIHYVESKLKINMKDFYDDYCENRYEQLDIERQELLKQLFSDVSEQTFINSLRARVKEPYHLVGKIVRKTLQKAAYSNITLSNYPFFIDDIMGFRIITLYSEDWYKVHKYLESKLIIDDANFIPEKQDLANRFHSLKDMSLFKKIEINARSGDDDIYSGCVGSDFERLFDKLDGRYYRSIHYSVYNKNHCLEIQVRSIYDEAWSEIDHNLLYPYYLDNHSLIEFSKILNRISGCSNELSSYFKEIVKNEKRDLPNALSPVPDMLGHELYMLGTQNHDKEDTPFPISPEKRTAQNINDGIKEI